MALTSPLVPRNGDRQAYPGRRRRGHHWAPRKSQGGLAWVSTYADLDSKAWEERMACSASGSRAITAKRCGTLLPRLQTTFHRPVSPALRGSLPSRVLKGWAGECASTHPFATVLSTAWLRRIDGITAEVIANRVATYLAFKQARTLSENADGVPPGGPVSDREAGPG